MDDLIQEVESIRSAFMESRYLECLAFPGELDTRAKESINWSLINLTLKLKRINSALHSF